MRRVVCPRRTAVRLAIASSTALTAFSLSSTRGNDVYWSSATNGTFSDPASWQGGFVPGTTDVAQFATSAGGMTGPYAVTFDSDASTVGATILGDDVTWDLGTHTYSVPGDSTTPALVVGSSAGGAGALSIKNGTVSSNNGSSSAVISGAGAAGSAASRVTVLPGGTLKITGRTYLGGSSSAASGPGVLNVAGGAATFTNPLKVWDVEGSQINLSSGKLSVGTLDLSGNPSRFFGDGISTGWTGGELVLNTSAAIDTAAPSSTTSVLGTTVTLAAGHSLTVNATEIIGYSGTGSLLQTGGVHTIGSTATQRLLELGARTTGAGTYTLNGAGATLTVNGSAYLGGIDTLARGTGVMNVAAGSATITGTLKLWDTPGTQFNLSGGSLAVAKIDLSGNGSGSRFNWTGGTLTLTSSGAAVDSTAPMDYSPIGSSITLDANHTLETRGHFYVGYSGAGSVTQVAVARAIPVNCNLYIGYNSTAVGSYATSGDDASLATSGSGAIIVGYFATGTRTNGVITQYGATFDQSGGTVSGPLTLAYAGTTSTARYTLSSGTCTGNKEVGFFGTGHFIQTGGSSIGDVDIGGQTSATGSSYTLSGDESILNAANEYVGRHAKAVHDAQGYVTQYGATFNQSGGTNTVTYLQVGEGGYDGPGQYNLSGGTLNAGYARINAYSSFNQTGGAFSCPTSDATFEAVSSFNLSGASSTFDTFNEFVRGTYTQSGGTNTTFAFYMQGGFLNNATLSGGSLFAKYGSTGAESIGYGDAATFTQTGGTNTVGRPGFNSSIILGGSTSAAIGTYNLSGADSVLSVIGDLNVTRGTFNMSGGSATFTGQLLVGNVAGNQVNLSGGVLSVGFLSTSNVPSRFLGNGTTTGWTGGEFNLMTSSADIGTATSTFGTALSLSGTKRLRIAGIDNSLTVKSGGTLTTTTMAVGGTFTSADQLGVTSIFSQTGGSTTVSGALDIRNTATANVSITGGTFGAGSIANAGTFTLGPSGTLNLTSGFTNTAGMATFAKTANWSPGATLGVGGGTVNLGARQDVGGVTVSGAGSLTLAAGVSNTLVTGTLAITGGGRLDLTNNAMVIRNTTVAEVRSLIQGAFNAGHWNGTGGGLTSSAAAANASGATAVGYGSNGILNKSSFKGVSPLTSTDVLVRYTYYGDADLSGNVTLDDFTLFLNGYQTGKTTWFNGDFDYNGAVTLDDFTLFLRGYQNQGAPLSELEALINSVPMSPAERAAMLAAVSAVPEPAALGMVALLGLGLSRRRRAGLCWCEGSSLP